MKAKLLFALPLVAVTLVACGKKQETPIEAPPPSVAPALPNAGSDPVTPPSPPTDAQPSAPAGAENKDAAAK